MSRPNEEAPEEEYCGLDDYVVLSKVKDLPARRETCIGSSLEYACRFWARHLAKVPGDGPDAKRIQEAIEEFFTKRLFHWVEVLSIVGNLGVAVYAINDIRQWHISVSYTRTHPYMVHPHTSLVRHLHL